VYERVYSVPFHANSAQIKLDLVVRIQVQKANKTAVSICTDLNQFVTLLTMWCILRMPSVLPSPALPPRHRT
jgi:hypothetical protein